MSADFLDEQAIIGVRQRTSELRATERAWEAAIVNARRRGISVRNIAEVAGVSPQTVLNICGRVTASGG